MFALYTPRYFPDYVGGGERLVQLIAAGLRELGEEVVILAGGDGGDQYVDGVPVRRLPLHGGAHWSDEAPRPEVLERALREIGARVLQTTTVAGLHVLAPVAWARRMRIGLVATQYDAICEHRTLVRRGGAPCPGPSSFEDCFACGLEGKRRRDRALSSLGRRLPGPVAGGIARGASVLARRPLAMQLDWWHEAQRVARQRRAGLDMLDVFVSPTQSALDLTAPHLGRTTRTACIMHPLPSELRRVEAKRTPAEVLRVGFVGRALPIKGLHTLVEAVESVIDRVPVELRVHCPDNAGEHRAYWRPLSERVARLAGSTWRTEGVLDASGLRRLHGELDVLAVPSVWPEWLGLVTLEAQGLGTPVILSDYPTQRDLAEGDGRSSWLVPPGDPVALAGALEQAWRCKQAGELAAPAVDYPTPREYAERLVELYGAGA